jgi:transposase
MSKDTLLPNDIEALKTLLLAEQGRNTQLEIQHQHVLHKNAQLEARVVTLQEQLHLALARRYAASSEKIRTDQLRLFDEAEAEAEAGGMGDVTTQRDDTIKVAGHTRSNKRGRRPLPDTLPRVDILHELPAYERVCDHDGALLQEIGEVVTEQLDIIPAKIQVIRHIRKKYACTCGKCLKTAPLPAQPIPKSLASPGLLAHIAVSKYQDALPLHRQETILQRIGVDLSRATLANWMIQAGALIQPLINLLRDHLLAYDILQMDETTVQVLNETQKTAQSQSYLWVQRGGPPDKPVVLFDYDPSRSQQVPVRLLGDFKGHLQTDGYDGYRAVVQQNKLKHVGCFAHARRKFVEAIKAQGKHKAQGAAPHCLDLIQQLYKIEKAVREVTPDQRYVYRQQHAPAIMTNLREYLDKALPTVPPKSATGKALAYLNNEWDKLIRYLDDGRLEIDNNLAENAIRPFVVGRKNWLFSQSVKGVNASANLYSLIETAKTNGLEPYHYLRYVFTELPKATTVDDIERLLPFHIKPDVLHV